MKIKRRNCKNHASKYNPLKRQSDSSDILYKQGRKKIFSFANVLVQYIPGCVGNVNLDAYVVTVDYCTIGLTNDTGTQ